MADVTFNGISASSLGVKILDITHETLPVILDQHVTIPGRHGSYLFPQAYGDRMVTVTAMINEHTFADARDKLFDISSWLHSTVKAPLYTSDTGGKYYMAKVLSASKFERTDGLGTFSVVFICEPFLYGDDISEIYTMDSGAMQGVYNTGTAEASPQITVIAAYGEIQTPAITINETTIVYNGTISTNGQVDLMSGTWSAYRGMDRDIMTTGAYDASEDSVLSMVAGEFPVLSPGPNSVRYDSVNSRKADIKIQYVERWL